MEVEKREVENGYIFSISGGEPAALLVRHHGEEKIYLPFHSADDSTYYVEGDSPAKSSYEFFHPGEFDEFEVLDVRSP